MNARTLFVALIMASALVASAQQAPTSFRTYGDPHLDWNLDPMYWEELIATHRDSGIKLGRTDIVLTGPLVAGFRRGRAASDDMTLGQRVLNAPIIRMFVPQPMPSPPGTGRYFAWGERPQPWTTVAARGAARGGDPAISHEPGALISFSW